MESFKCWVCTGESKGIQGNRCESADLVVDAIYDSRGVMDDVHLWVLMFWEEKVWIVWLVALNPDSEMNVNTYVLTHE